VPGDVSRWPTWITPENTREAALTGYGGLARYVVPELLDEMSARQFASGQRALVAQADRNPIDVRQEVVGRLWADFVTQSISYAGPPWNSGTGQRIRHPAWLLRRGASGTCLDLATFFAGACLNQDLETYLVMISDGDSGHAAVAVRLGGALGSLPEGCERCLGEGMLKVADADALCHDQNILLLDLKVGTAGTPDQSQQSAIEILTSELARPGVESHLVNVAQRHLEGDIPFGFQPTYQGALVTHIEPSPSHHLDLPSRDEVRAHLAHSTGIVVVRGESGVGKSTVAREAAIMADEGFGWFLSGASKSAYQASLARHELVERGRPDDVIDSVNQPTLAREALSRLAYNEGGWIVVIDNADNGPGDLGPLPKPGPEQLVIFTSTAEPNIWDGYRIEELGPLTESETADAVSGLRIDDRIVKAIEGSPLLLRAFRTLLQTFPNATDALQAGEPVPASGADLYWLLAGAALGEVRPFACEAALLPPDLIEGSALTDSEPSPPTALAGVGLLEERSPGIYSMHRLLGQAVRRGSDPAVLAQAAERVLSSLEGVNSLTRYADLSVLNVLRDALGESPSGTALWGLATVEEMHDGKASPITFERAAMVLDASVDAERGFLADCLHSRGRVVNQEEDPPPEKVQWAIGQVDQAIALRRSDEEIAIAKHQALLALLRQRIVWILPEGSEERLVELHSICDVLDESYEKRKGQLGEGDPLVDRAYFNRAGIRIMLCQEDASNRAAHLDEAETVYRTTMRYRRAYYSMPSPLTAASIAGIATWGYFAALYGICDEPENVLSEAMAAGLEALELRKNMPNRGDIAKSAGSLAKLNLLQSQMAGGKLYKTLAESFIELELQLDDLGKELRSSDGK
jgi:hypothetical protein